MEIVDAIAGRDATAAVQLIREYHRTVIKRVQTSPRAKEMKETDPELTTFLSSWLRTNVGLGHGIDRGN
jgi:hypothetical protein